MSDMFATMKISAAGMHANSARINVISQNVANADSAPQKLGDNPYTRKVITFKNVLDKASGEQLISPGKIETDQKSEYIKKYMPGHPAADADGYVMMPNVNTLIEMMDMKEASKSYEANMGMYTQTRDMMSKTIDILR